MPFQGLPRYTPPIVFPFMIPVLGENYLNQAPWDSGYSAIKNRDRTKIEADLSCCVPNLQVYLLTFTVDFNHGIFFFLSGSIKTICGEPAKEEIRR